MREKIKKQMTFGMTPIKSIEFNIYSRHEIIPILVALQHCYVFEKQIIHKCLNLIHQDIISNQSENLGCAGLTYWEILVLASVRLGCKLDYDALQDLADNHIKLRQMLKVDDKFDEKNFPRSTIHDNLSLLTEKTLNEISNLIIGVGHRFIPEAIKQLRGDSFVTKKDIHYPTDSNLPFDGIRKIIDLSVKISSEHGILGWRQHSYLLKKLKKIKRSIEKVARSRAKGREAQLLALYEKLIKEIRRLINRSLDTIKTFQDMKRASKEKISRYWDGVVSNLFFFIAGTEYVCDLAERRMIKGENIPNSEKVFSLFEPDTELINRGKKPYPYEFGHRVLIIEDSAGLIVHSHVMGMGVTDEKVLVDVMQKLQKQYNDKIISASFDKGFWSPENLKKLSEIVDIPCLPKKGKRSGIDAEREGSKEFGTSRKRHPGVESAIHALMAGNGLDKCKDRGYDGYKRYVALGVLGRNLHTLGRILIDKNRIQMDLKPLKYSDL